MIQGGLEFTIPSRGIIGLNNIVLTLSAGEAIMAHRFLEFQPWKGNIDKRQNGSIIAGESGNAFAYALDKLQDRGHFFIEPQTMCTKDRWSANTTRKEI